MNFIQKLQQYRPIPITKQSSDSIQQLQQQINPPKQVGSMTYLSPNHDYTSQRPRYNRPLPSQILTHNRVHSTRVLLAIHRHV